MRFGIPWCCLRHDCVVDRVVDRVASELQGSTIDLRRWWSVEESIHAILVTLDSPFAAMATAVEECADRERREQQGRGKPKHKHAASKEAALF